VEDNGIGMDQAVLAHIFEPFFTTKGAGKGTGIGLATVHGVIQSAGGYIDVASTLGQGTRFDIYLPSTELKEARSVSSRETALGREELVALVEDQAAVRAVAYTQLTLLGYRVMAFASAEEALAGLEHDLPRVDVLLTDVVMSGLHGPAMVDILRSRRPNLRVVYMSGYTDEIVMSRGVGTQLSGLLRKPFTLEELAHALRSALSA
jgi:CheY-like chemotaxis protein